MTIFQIAALVLIMANLYLIFKVRTEKRFYISLMWALSMILLGILLINNLILYKQKLKDRLSLMLLFAVIMCGFEILWTFCDGHPRLKALTYIGGE